MTTASPTHAQTCHGCAVIRFCLFSHLCLSVCCLKKKQVPFQQHTNDQCFKDVEPLPLIFSSSLFLCVSVFQSLLFYLVPVLPPWSSFFPASFSLFFCFLFEQAPFAEEFVFRATMLPLLLQCLGPVKAILLSPLFFGVGKS